MTAFRAEPEAQEVVARVSDSGQDWSQVINTAGILAICVLFICAVKLAIALIQGVRLYVIAQLECCQPNFKKRYGEWAVVTGAAHGLGLAFAKELASRGMSIVLVDIVDLDVTKRLIEAIPNAGVVETLRLDLADSSLENFDKMRQQLDPARRDIGILINNAGIYPQIMQRFDKFPMGYHLKMANLNLIHPLHTTHIILPAMIERGRGMVVNVSSVGILMTLPFMGFYNPSKTCVAALTRQLQAEYASEPIDIILLTTGPIGIFKQAKSNFMLVSPDKYARSAINAAAAGLNEYCGTMWHGILSHLFTLMEWTGTAKLSMHFMQRNKPEAINVSPDPDKCTSSDFAYYRKKFEDSRLQQLLADQNVIVSNPA